MIKHLLLIIIYGFLLCFLSVAQEDTNFCDKPEVIFYNTNEAIYIDGKDDDDFWQSADIYSYKGYSQTSIEGVMESDLSFRFRGGWDYTGIYLLVEVTDDKMVRYLQEEEQSCEIWMTDNVEYFFNPTGKRTIVSEEIEFPFSKSTQLRIRSGDETLDTPNINGQYMGSWYDQQDLQGSIFKYMVTYPTGGYIIESWFSWDAILPEMINGVPVDELPKRWGFTINVGDSDDTEIERDAIAVWAGAGLEDNQWCNINYLGVMYLDIIIDLPQINLDDIYFYMQDEHEYLGDDNRIDFGTLEVNQDSTVTIILYNGNSETLNAFIDIDGEGYRLINTSSDLNLEPGESKQVTIQFKPNEIDQYSGRIVFYTSEGIFYIIDLVGETQGYENIQNFSDVTFKIQPNPAHDNIVINTPIAEKYEIEIYDMLGRKLLSKQSRNNEIINISSFKKGSYIIKVYFDHQVYSQLFNKY
ncbi:sugar-binding protein [Bacteroidota bacterium]